MEIVDEFVIRNISKNGNGSPSVKLSKDEKKAKIDKLTDEYNRLYIKSKEYRVVPSEIVNKCKEIILELKMLKVFRPRRSHSF